MASALAGGFAQGFLQSKLNRQAAEGEKAKREDARQDLKLQLASREGISAAEIAARAEEGRLNREQALEIERQKTLRTGRKEKAAQLKDATKQDQETLAQVHKTINGLAVKYGKTKLSPEVILSAIPKHQHWALTGLPSSSGSGVRGLNLLKTVNIGGTAVIGEIKNRVLPEQDFGGQEGGFVEHGDVDIHSARFAVQQKVEKDGEAAAKQIRAAIKGYPRLQVTPDIQVLVNRAKKAGIPFNVKDGYIYNQEQVTRDIDADRKNILDSFTNIQTQNDIDRLKEVNLEDRKHVLSKLGYDLEPPSTSDFGAGEAISQTQHINNLWNKQLTQAVHRIKKADAVKTEEAKQKVQDAAENSGMTAIFLKGSLPSNALLVPNHKSIKYRNEVFNRHFDVSSHKNWAASEDAKPILAYSVLQYINSELGRGDLSSEHRKNLIGYLKKDDVKNLFNIIAERTMNGNIQLSLPPQGNVKTSKQVPINNLSRVVEAYKNLGLRSATGMGSATGNRVQTLARANGVSEDTVLAAIHNNDIRINPEDQTYNIGMAPTVVAPSQPVDSTQTIEQDGNITESSNITNNSPIPPHVDDRGEAVNSPVLQPAQLFNRSDRLTSLFLADKQSILLQGLDANRQKQLVEYYNATSFADSGKSYFEVIDNAVKNPNDREAVKNFFAMVRNVNDLSADERRDELNKLTMSNYVKLLISQNATIKTVGDRRVVANIVYVPPDPSKNPRYKSILATREQLEKAMVPLTFLRQSFQRLGAITTAKERWGSNSTDYVSILQEAKSLGKMLEDSDEFRKLREDRNVASTYTAFRTEMEKVGSAVPQARVKVGAFYNLIKAVGDAIGFGKSLVKSHVLEGLSIEELEAAAQDENKTDLDVNSRARLNRVIEYNKNRVERYNKYFENVKARKLQAERTGDTNAAAAAELRMMELMEIGRIQNLQISLTYYYAGMVQGTAGGRAISNEDFQNIFKALWAGGVGGEIQMGSFQQVVDIVSDIRNRNVLEGQLIGYGQAGENIRAKARTFSKTLFHANFESKYAFTPERERYPAIGAGNWMKKGSKRPKNTQSMPDFQQGDVQYSLLRTDNSPNTEDNYIDRMTKIVDALDQKAKAQDWNSKDKIQQVFKSSNDVKRILTEFLPEEQIKYINMQVGDARLSLSSILKKLKNEEELSEVEGKALQPFTQYLKDTLLMRRN